MTREVRLSHECARQLRRLCRGAAPAEFVAVLGGPDAGDARRDRPPVVDTVIELPNTAPRDDAFAVDPIAFSRVEATLRATGRRFAGFAHSHPGGTPAPSARDLAELWPGCIQLIAGCDTDGGRARFGAFVIDGGGGAVSVRLGPCDARASAPAAASAAAAGHAS